MVILKENDRNEFSDETVEWAWKRSGGYCEECGKKLKWEDQGRDNDDFWEAHHKDGNPKNDKPENCQILCYGCHKETDNFGRHKENVRLGLRIKK
jgi:5-methylcytosine-specific restriction endonuclease McrA